MNRRRVNVKDTCARTNLGLALLACAALPACVAAPEPHALPPAPAIARAPAPSIALEREVRHYVDEQGQYWDDRGRRLERKPGANAPVSP